MLKTSLAVKLSCALALWGLLPVLCACLAVCAGGSGLLLCSLVGLAWLLSLPLAWLLASRLAAPLLALVAACQPGAQTMPDPDIATGDEFELLSRALQARLADLQAAQDVRHHLNAVLDSLPVPIFYRDLCSSYLGVNCALEAYLGRSRDQIVGHTVFDLFPPETARSYFEADRDLLARGGVQQYESQVVYPDGSTRDVILFKALFRDSTGQPAGVVGSLLDITERTQAERLLAEQKDFSESLVQNLAVPAFVVNANHEVLIWNRACEELTGIPAAELIGSRRHWEGFYQEEQPTLADRVLDGDYREADNRDNLHWYRSNLLPDGVHGETWAKNRGCLDGYLMFGAAPIRNRNGEVVAAIETVQDISARKRTEDRLRTLSLAVEQSPSIVVITDAAGTIEYVNRKFVEVTGYSSAEVVGGNPSLLKSGSTPAELYRELWSTIGAGREWRGEFQNRKKNGALYLELASISPVLDDMGGICHYIALKEDVTERRALEQALRHAQKMESLGTLTGGVAHDFNNILTAIMGYANLIQMKSPPDSPCIRFADQVVASAEKAAVLTRGLLAYSKNQAMNPSHLNLNDIVSRVDRLLSRVLGEQISCQSELSSEPLRLFADAGHLEQVLMNLAMNARDAMPDGGSLRIRTEPFEMDQEFIRNHGFGAPGSYALLSVADDGVGLDAATLERIFEPFFTTHQVGGGPGLGLSIVHGIVEQHQGYIGVTSAPGQGSVFSVYLPLVRPVTRTLQAAPRSGGGETVLLVEDNQEVRGIIGEILRGGQYRVLEAANSEEGMRHFTRHDAPVSLLLVDVIMPGKGGLEFYREIRMLDPGVRVLFMSGYSEEYIRSKGVLDRDLAFIAKPLTPADLLERVRGVLDAA